MLLYGEARFHKTVGGSHVCQTISLGQRDSDISYRLPTYLIRLQVRIKLKAYVAISLPDTGLSYGPVPTSIGRNTLMAWFEVVAAELIERCPGYMIAHSF